MKNYYLSKQNKLKNLALEFEANIIDIRSKTLLFSNDIFRLFEGYIAINKEDQAVYLIQLRFFDSSLITNKDLEKQIEYLYEDIDEFKSFTYDKLFLKRQGYFVKSEENLIYFAYLKENKSLLSETKLIEIRNSPLASLQIIYDLGYLVKELHLKNRKMSLIHPNLLFLNDVSNNIHYLDFIFDTIIDKVKKSDNFQISNFFGFFDMDFAEALEKNDTEFLSTSNTNLSNINYMAPTVNNNNKEQSKVFFKSDIVMLCCLTVWLFSFEKDIQYEKENKKNIKIEKIIYPTFEKVVYDLQKDYLLENKLFSNFLANVSDVKIKNFILNCLNIDYRLIRDVHFFMSEVELLIQRILNDRYCVYCLDTKLNNKEISGNIVDNSLEDNKKDEKNENSNLEDNKNNDQSNNIEDASQIKNDTSEINKSKNDNSHVIIDNKKTSTFLDNSKSNNNISSNNNNPVNDKEEKDNIENQTIYNNPSILSQNISNTRGKIRNVLEDVKSNDKTFATFTEEEIIETIDSKNNKSDNMLDINKNLIKITDQEISEKQENHNFDKIRLSFFKKIVKYSDISNVFCFICIKQNKNQINNKSNKENINEKYNKYLAELNKIKGIFEIIPELQDKEIREYFVNNVEGLMSNICEINETISAYVINNDKKINSLLEYFENLISLMLLDYIRKSKKCISQYSLEINLFVEEIDKFREEVLNTLQIDYTNLLESDLNNRNSIIQIEEKRISNSFSTKRNSFLSEFYKKVMENSEYIHLKDLCDHSISKIKILIKHFKRVKMNLDFDLELITTLEILKSRLDDFEEEIRNKTLTNFTNSLKDYRFTNPYISDTSESDVTLFDELHETKSFPNNIGSFDHINYLLYVYSNTKNQIYKLSFNKNSKKIESIDSSSRFVNMKNKLVITGGTLKNVDKLEMHDGRSKNSGYSDQIKAVDFAYYISLPEVKKSKQTFMFEKLPPMIHARAYHCMLRLSDFTLLVIGGKDTNTCEEYSFLLRRWISKASLPFSIFESSVFLYNSSDVYLFFGKKNSPKRGLENFNSVLKLSLYSNNPIWKEVNFKREDLKLDIKISMAGILEISENKLLILGGKEDESKCQSLFYDITLKSIYGLVEKSNDNSQFYESEFIQLDDKRFALFNTKNDMIFQSIEPRVFGYK